MAKGILVMIVFSVISGVIISLSKTPLWLGIFLYVSGWLSGFALVSFYVLEWIKKKETLK